MLKQLFELAERLLAITRDIRGNQAAIKRLEKQVETLSAAVRELAFELRRLGENDYHEHAGCCRAAIQAESSMCRVVPTRTVESSTACEAQDDPQLHLESDPLARLARDSGLGGTMSTQRDHPPSRAHLPGVGQGRACLAEGRNYHAHARERNHDQPGCR